MPNKNDRLSPYELNPLELLVARIHMAPSEFFNKIYEPERKEWKKGDAYAATSVTASRKLIKEKELFVDLVFSVYDVHDDVHFQRFLLFLKLVLQHHNDTSKQDHDFMPPDSVEWMLFCRGLSAGKGRARLRASFQKALSGIRLDGEQKNDVWSYINNPEADYDTLVGYVRQMNNAANRFVNVISKKFVERIMDATNEVVDVLYDVLERHYRKFMLGELLIKAIIQVVLDDLDYFYQSDKMMDKGILRFVLLHLKHQKLKTSSWRDDRKNHKEPTLRAAKEHLLDITKNHSEEVRNRIKANTETILPDLTLFKLKRLYEGNSEEEFEEVWRSPFTIFLDYIKTVRTKLMDEKKEKNNPREEMNNNLLTQFLKDRSTFSPCVLQISLRSIHRFLMLRTPYEEKSPHKEIFWKALIRYEMGYIKTRKQINQIIEEIFETRKERTWMSNWQAINEGVCTNVRLDLFMADQERPIVNNRQCFNIWTPRYSNVNEVAEGNDSKRSQLGKPVNTVILSEEDCVKLYFTLKDDDFQKIVEKNESQNAWVMIIKGLSKLREGALEDSNNKLVQHLEWCRRTVRKLVTKDKKTIIKLGVSIARRGQDPIELANKVEGIPQDALDPGTLMEKLRGIDTKTLQSNIKLQRNLRIITKVIKHVKSKTSEVTKEAKDLIEIFRTLSRSTEDEKTKQNLAVFYGIWRNKNDHSLVRKYKATHVSMIRGNILCKSYLEMTKKGLLLPVQLKDQSDTLQTKGGKEWTKLGDDYEESSYGCCMGVDPTIRRFIEFKKGLQFVFLTSERPDLVHLNILYVNPKTTRHDQITANERNLILQLEFTLRGGELWVYEVGKPRLPMEEQQSNKLLSIEYNPLGDDVPIRKKVLFDFKNLSLYKFLKSNELHRPNKVFDVEQLLSKNGLQDVLLDVLV
ncbi:hypothetical protein AAMO2058_000979600 [Amorphochlora amoebiformis]|uniref:Uncharacterized protein n=1 Tax=Amorphochlora amoebiformis TaxID=1561963 RepID=A0A7S0H8V1_9EUKA|mmetsp:Transcript_6708/g.10376  ORF Transcript_6708/g.10376 Transcript_6708/m.10376 type:complete len:915 (+) Transcript_6708:1251-3995(+)